MRLTQPQAAEISRLATALAGAGARVRLFGSRVDEAARGGDADLLLELPGPVENSALMAAKLSASILRILGGRRFDVVIMAPNLARLPIHDLALRDGVLL